jgi:hypothetical protein
LEFLMQQQESTSVPMSARPSGSLLALGLGWRSSIASSGKQKALACFFEAACLFFGVPQYRQYPEGK